MRKSVFHLMIILSVVCLFPQPSISKTGYVSDMLLLTFRQGPGSSYPVIKTLKSNTPVNILEEENDYYKVELESNEIGWVDKKFIAFDEPKTFIIDELTQKNKALEGKIEASEALIQKLQEQISAKEAEYAEKLSSLEADLKTAVEEKTDLTGSLSDSREKYDTLIEQSKNIQAIVKENKILKEKETLLSNELETLTSSTRNLFKTSMIKWFLAGVGTLLFGWIIGQSVSSKKRRSGSLLLG